MTKKKATGKSAPGKVRASPKAGGAVAAASRERRFPVVGIGASGKATDGTLGLKAIKGASGMAIVQPPQSAKYAGMPGSAIAPGLADDVLPPGLRDLLENLLPKNQSFQNYGVEAEFPKLGRRVFVLNGRRLEQEAGLPGMILSWSWKMLRTPDRMEVA